MGKFIISKASNGEYRFKLKANNSAIVLVSEGYTSKSACENGINAVRINSQNNDRFEIRTAANGKSYFILKATNGQVIGVSQLYETKTDMETGLNAVKLNAIGATIEDQSI